MCRPALRRVCLNPAPHCCMIDRQASLRHKFLEVTEAECKGEIPADTRHDHGSVELTLRWTPKPGQFLGSA